MTNPFLVIQLRPEDETADNELEAIRVYGGIADHEFVRMRVERTGMPEINLADYAAIIVGGSPFDVSAPEVDKSPVQKQIESAFMKLLSKIVDADFPFLGACSGSGLLGNFCGATISGRYSEPVGATDIMITDEGKSDPLLAGLPIRFRALLGHKEACDEVPPGAVLLASSAACPVQMFRVGSNVYATQFHPEGDADGFSLRIKVYKNHGYFPPDSADKLIDSVTDEDTPEAQKILRRFVDRYRETR